MRREQFTAFTPYFNEEEAWGDYTRVEWHHIHHLYLIRATLKKAGYDWPMKIHCSFDPGSHAANSLHHNGGISIATDFHFITDIPFRDQVTALGWALIDCCLQDFLGVGIYPEWNNPGFHIDSREKKTRWGHIQGKYIYDMQKVKQYICKGDQPCLQSGL